MKIFWKTLFTILMASFGVIGFTHAGEDGSKLPNFYQANELYNQGKYEAALEVYQEVAKSSPGYPVFYNMGNSYFRLGQIGNSIVHYRKALRYDPRNSELVANLRYAREEAKDEIEDNKGLKTLGILFFWHNDLTLKEALLAVAVIYALFMVLATVRLYRKFDYLGLSLSGLAVLFLLLSSSAGLKYYQESYTQEGAVVHKEVSIHSANDPNSVVLFKLHDGAEFRVLDARGDWMQIELKDRKKGWVVRKLTELI